MSEMINLPVSGGEYLDRLTILQVKLSRVSVEKVKGVSNLLFLFEEKGKDIDFTLVETEISLLQTIHRILWEIEDGKRLLEKLKLHNLLFIYLSRIVVWLNDERARIKGEIDRKLGYDIKEEKEYVEY